ncbi:hypothetical protein Asi03nite_08870 [Actinoplanes siamensis]|uniref:Uncharacterized protein n=1 Tax=Actinoplanes siamensis TaxID=1223317 RepID=A0A919KB38_9ACTN|nr:hypothetical protein Asi03nite_08870 [Actinoplanes siamensis]
MAALAAAHAAAVVLVPLPAQAADRLIGVIGAPCADAGTAGTAEEATAARSTTARRRRTDTGIPQMDHTTGTFPVTRGYGDPAPLVQRAPGCDCMTGSGNTIREDS